MPPLHRVPSDSLAPARTLAPPPACPPVPHLAPRCMSSPHAARSRFQGDSPVRMLGFAGWLRGPVNTPRAERRHQGDGAAHLDTGRAFALRCGSTYPGRNVVVRIGRDRSGDRGGVSSCPAQASIHGAGLRTGGARAVPQPLPDRKTAFLRWSTRGEREGLRRGPVWRASGVGNRMSSQAGPVRSGPAREDDQRRDPPHALRVRGEVEGEHAHRARGRAEPLLDICAMLGLPSPTEADPTGELFTFERGAAKAGGGEGWADVWKRDMFAREYKGKRKTWRPRTTSSWATRTPWTARRSSWSATSTGSRSTLRSRTPRRSPTGSTWTTSRSPRMSRCGSCGR